jgi:hypothetical protein
MSIDSSTNFHSYFGWFNFSSRKYYRNKSFASFEFFQWKIWLIISLKIRVIKICSIKLNFVIIEKTSEFVLNSRTTMKNLNSTMIEHGHYIYKTDKNIKITFWSSLICDIWSSNWITGHIFHQV